MFASVRLGGGGLMSSVLLVFLSIVSQFVLHVQAVSWSLGCTEYNLLFSHDVMSADYFDISSLFLSSVDVWPFMFRLASRMLALVFLFLLLCKVCLIVSLPGVAFENGRVCLQTPV
jgi:hypothetical protein